MSFRLRGQAYLLTWSQVEEDWSLSQHDLFESIVRLLRLLGTVEYCRVARELHRDSGVHYHAFVRYNIRIDRRITDQLDWGGQHPNIKIKRTKREQQTAITYLEKEGTYHDEGRFPDLDQGPNSPDVAIDIIGQLELQPDYLGWLDWCFQHQIPAGYATEFWKAGRNKTETISDSTEDTGYLTLPELQELRFDTEDERAMVIVGPTGCGKTTWARQNAPKPALFVRHGDDLKAFRAGYHKSIIFDDMHFAGDENGKGAWPRTSQIHLLDWFCGSSIHCRYITAFIPAKTHKIFVSNEYPFTHDQAIERRINRINLY